MNIKEKRELSATASVQDMILVDITRKIPWHKPPIDLALVRQSHSARIVEQLEVS